MWAPVWVPVWVLALSWARAATVARPMPEEAPVTIATPPLTAGREALELPELPGRKLGSFAMLNILAAVVGVCCRNAIFLIVWIL